MNFYKRIPSRISLRTLNACKDNRDLSSRATKHKT